MVNQLRVLSEKYLKKAWRWSNFSSLFTQKKYVTCFGHIIIFYRYQIIRKKNTKSPPKIETGRFYPYILYQKSKTKIPIYCFAIQMKIIWFFFARLFNKLYSESSRNTVSWAFVYFGMPKPGYSKDFLQSFVGCDHKVWRKC